jgi:hypothetical protein
LCRKEVGEGPHIDGDLVIKLTSLKRGGGLCRKEVGEGPHIDGRATGHTAKGVRFKGKHVLTWTNGIGRWSWTGRGSAKGVRGVVMLLWCKALLPTARRSP